MLENSYAFQDGDYILQNQNGQVAFYKYKADNGNTWYSSPYRAFLQIGKDATFSCFNFPVIDGVAPVVISSDSGREAGIYSIDGMRRTKLQPGLNIIVDENGNTRKLFINK